MCRKARAGEDTNAILNSIKALEKSSYRIAELMYREAST